MAQAGTRQLVTANRLHDGVPVYYAGGDAWAPAIASAMLVEAAGAESLLAKAQEGKLPRPVVAPYLVEAAIVAEGAVRPLLLRERIRAGGPTI